MLVGLVLTVGTAFAQTGRGVNPPAGAVPPPVVDELAQQPLCAEALAPMDFTSNEACYIPEKKAFVLIDSIDCAVDLLVRQADGLQRVGRFTTDTYRGRHDLVNILRPKSVSVMGDKILVLASSKKDTSYLAVVSMDPVKCNDEQGFDSLKAVSLIGFSSNAYAFHVDPANNEIIAVGKNPVGYDINFVSFNSSSVSRTASKLPAKPLPPPAPATPPKAKCMPPSLQPSMPTARISTMSRTPSSPSRRPSVHGLRGMQSSTT